MKKRKVKKTLISPKVRLLLWVCLHGVEDESNYLAKLSDKLDYSEGSIKAHLIDLLDKGLIKSLNPDGVSPPYRGTSEAKKLLEPIFFVRKIGYFFAVFVSCTFLTLIGWYIHHLEFLMLYWVPLTLAGFVFLITILILYPYMLLKCGKIAFPGSK
jgi:DNA-binding transcriptional ArsR family regulator